MAQEGTFVKILALVQVLSLSFNSSGAGYHFCPQPRSRLLRWLLYILYWNRPRGIRSVIALKAERLPDFYLGVVNSGSRYLWLGLGPRLEWMGSWIYCQCQMVPAASSETGYHIGFEDLFLITMIIWAYCLEQFLAALCSVEYTV